MRVKVYNTREKRVALCQVEDWQNNCKRHNPKDGWLVYSPEVPSSVWRDFEGAEIISPEQAGISLLEYENATAPTFMDEYTDEEKDAVALDVGGQLFENWLDANTDDILETDLEIIRRSDYKDLQGKFTAHQSLHGDDSNYESFMTTLDPESLKRLNDEMALQFFDEWYQSNLDEGSYYADQQVAEMSNNPKVHNDFNTRYDLTPDDPEYI